MRKVRTEEADIQGLDSLEILATVLYNFGVRQNDFTNYVERTLKEIQDLSVSGFDVYEIKNKDKQSRDSFRKFYHAVVNLEVSGKTVSFGYNINENRVSFKAGDRSIRYYELYSNKDEEVETIAEIIAIIKRVAKI